jgi:ell wall binding domain 2 (CWB2)
MRPPHRAALCVCCAALIATGCGRHQESGHPSNPTIGLKGNQKQAAAKLGFPSFATANTTRVGGGDPIADAAAVARAVYPAASPGTRPAAVALVDARNWQAGVAASVLIAAPIGAPILLSDGATMPAATTDALKALRPAGSRAAGNAQVIRIGSVPRPAGWRLGAIAGPNPFALARAIDAYVAAARKGASASVLVVSARDPAYAMPAAAWAAKSGDPVLFTERDSLPDDTREAIAAHGQVNVYILGPTSVVGPGVERALRHFGRVTRIEGADPVANAIAFARFADGSFGWGVVDPGHGMVFASPSRPLDAAAAAPLSASGAYGPLLLMGPRADQVPPALQAYLLDVQPGYTKDPVRGVYNHGWIVGDESAIALGVQSRLDELLKIIPVAARKTSP